MIRVDVNIKDQASGLLDILDDAVSGSLRASLNEVGARSANTAAIEYHEAYGSAGGWRGSRYLGAGTSMEGEFSHNVALAWNVKEANESGATISNNATGYNQKVEGGTIKPKRAKALTIPLVSEAYGKRAADYEAQEGVSLFRIRGGKALFENRNGSLRAVYALKKSVTQRPWDGALPPEDVIADSFVEGWTGALADILE